MAMLSSDTYESSWKVEQIVHLKHFLVAIIHLIGNTKSEIENKSQQCRPKKKRRKKIQKILTYTFNVMDNSVVYTFDSKFQLCSLYAI